MSAYPGFTDGDLRRQALEVRRDLRYAEITNQDEKADAAREELGRIETEQRRRSS